MRGSNIKVSTVTQFILSTKIINTYFSLRIPTIATFTLDLQLSRGEEDVIDAVCELEWCISEKTLSKQYVIFMAYI